MTTTTRLAHIPLVRAASLLAAATLAFATAGCVSLAQGTKESKSYSGGYAGDRESIDLGAVVVAIPVQDDAKSYRNLRVWMEAIVNTRRTTLHERDAWLLVARQRPRAQGAAVEALAKIKPTISETLSTARGAAEAAAQAAIDKGFAAWEHARDFQVEVVVTTIEFVDDSRPSPLTWGR